MRATSGVFLVSVVLCLGCLQAGCRSPVGITTAASQIDVQVVRRYFLDIHGAWQSEEVKAAPSDFFPPRKVAESISCDEECLPTPFTDCPDEFRLKVQPELCEQLNGLVGKVALVALLEPPPVAEALEGRPAVRFLGVDQLLLSGERKIESFLERVNDRPGAAEHLIAGGRSAVGPLVRFLADAQGVAILNELPEVTYLQLALSPDALEPSPTLGEAVSDTLSHHWNDIGGPRALTGETLGIALLDNGVDRALVEASSQRHLDLWGCDDNGCCKENDNRCTVSDADHRRHGSLSWSLLDRHLPPSYPLRSYDVFYGSNTLWVDGYCKAIEHAMRNGIQMIVAEVAMSQTDQVVSQCSESAVSTGITVIAAAGNRGPDRCCLSSPALAATVVSVGAWDLVSGTTIRQQSLGPSPDGRVKPDVQAPTNTTLVLDGKSYPFTHTSGALPYLAALAGRLGAWLFEREKLGAEAPGHLWPLLVALGDQVPPFNGTRGAGLAQYRERPVAVWSGRLTLDPDTSLAVPLPADAGSEVAVAIWSARPFGSAATDLDLCLRPNRGSPRCSPSRWSVFERHSMIGPGTAIVHHGGTVGTATVYFGAFELRR